MDGQIIYRIALAAVLGGFIGLERQIHQTSEPNNKKGNELGLRTFSIIGLLGSLMGVLYTEIPYLAGIFSVFTALLGLMYYFFDSWLSRDYGITTEMAMGYVFVVGFLLGAAAMAPLLLIGMTIFVAVILLRKDTIHEMIDNINTNELRSFISYLVIALIILPL